MTKVITVILEVQDEVKAREIWRAHGDGNQLAGCRVTGIGNGDYFSKVRHYEDGLNEVLAVAERHTGSQPIEEIMDIIDKIPS